MCRASCRHCCWIGVAELHHVGLSAVGLGTTRSTFPSTVLSNGTSFTPTTCSAGKSLHIPITQQQPPCACSHCLALSGALSRSLVRTVSLSRAHCLALSLSRAHCLARSLSRARSLRVCACVCARARACVCVRCPCLDVDYFRRTCPRCNQGCKNLAHLQLHY